MVPRSISFYDLKCIPGAIGIMQRNNKDEIDNLLFQLGFDTRIGWELVECHHRPLTSNQAVFGFRVEGVERCDPAWIKSDNSSLEARIEAVEDKTLREALVEMNRTGSADKTWINEDAAKAVVRSEAKNYQKKV